MKPTIFKCILLATLLPLLLLFFWMAFTIQHILDITDTQAAKKTTLLLARQTSSQIADTLSEMESMLDITSDTLSSLDYEAPGAQRRADALLRNLLTSDPSFYCARFVFEPDTLRNNTRYYKSFTQKNGILSETGDITDETLDNRELSPWYLYTLVTGQAYLNMVSQYDYGLGEGGITVGSMACPVRSNGMTIGVVGLDIRYESLLEKDSFKLSPRQKLLLLSSDGLILYSDNHAEVGHSLMDYYPRNREPITESMRRGALLQEEYTSPFSKERAFICLAPIPITKAGQTIYLYLDIPTKDLYTSAASSMQVIVFTGILGLFLVACSVFFASRGVVRPIWQLTADFNKISSGDLDVPLEGDIHHKTHVVELDILQSSLRKMLAQIRASHEASLNAAAAKAEKEKIQTASAAKSHFFATMSHEIRTPMNAVLGIAEILLHDVALSAPHRKYISDIKISSESLLTVINDILDLSKMESGRLELMAVHYNFEELMAGICSLAQYLASGKNLTFRYNTVGLLPKCLFGDDVRLKQILLNLLSNAVKFTHSGFVDLCVHAEEDLLRFVVTDTGVGIKQENLARIFNPFQQVDLPHNRGIQGTGLGLSICSNLAHLMGGTVHAASTYGVGSVFTVCIPKIIGNETMLEQHDEDEVVLYDPSVNSLIVDDNEINLNVAAGLLKTLHGIRSDLALSGQEALEMLRAKAYDIIFMDHMMPGMDGVETTRHIRAMDGKNANVTIIALTANAVIGMKETLITAGMNDFLPKPIRRAELSKILRRWIPEDKRAAANKSAPPATTPRKEFSQVLSNAAKLEELDIAFGMEMLEGQQEEYEHLLHLLAEKIPKVCLQLTEALAAGQLKNFTIHIHGLKSALACTGAQQLCRLAQDMEKAALSGNDAYCREYWPLLAHRLQTLARQLGQMFAETVPKGPRQAGDRLLLKKNLHELRHALARYEYDMVSRCMENIQGMDYGPDINAALAQLRTQTEAFDYDAASECLNSIRP